MKTCGGLELNPFPQAVNLYAIRSVGRDDCDADLNIA